jgi:diacylglycerol O-acyltransferase
VVRTFGDMRRVDSAGSGFLYGETPGWHMHVGAVMLLDPIGAAGFGFEAVKRLYAQRLGRVPNLRARLVEVPLGLDRPALADDPGFDVDAHCQRATLPPPGTFRQLSDVVGDLMARKIDRQRPLWETWWIDGLDDGRVAIFTKLHHALVDGVSGMQLAALVMDTEPAPGPEAETTWAASPGLSEPSPSMLHLGAGAARTLAALPWRSVRYLNQLAHQSVTYVSYAARPDSPPLAFSAPRTAFNVPIGSGRCVAACSLPMDDILAVKQTFGTSVNDILLTIVGGALRQHLDERGELPRAPLVAQVPVSVRAPGTEQELGTQVVNMFTTLATDVGESAERLRVVSSVTRRAKQFQHDLFADRAVALPDLVPPCVISLGARAFTGLGLERHVRLFNAIVSDVRGSPIDLYIAGARVDAIYPLGPLLLGAALNVTALSHLDRLHVGIVATPDALPDPWAVAEHMQTELSRLHAAAVGARDTA